MSVTVEACATVEAHPVGRYLRTHPETSIRLGRVVPTAGFTQYLWVAGPGAADLVAAVQRDQRLGAKVAVLDRIGEETLLKLELDAPPALFAAIDDADAVLQEVVGSATGWELVSRFPDRQAAASWFEAVRAADVDLELRQIRDTEVHADADSYGLSATQAETVLAAFDAGYFDVPRDVSLREFAGSMDVSDQAVSERLRRGLSQLLSATISADEANSALAGADTVEGTGDAAAEPSDSGPGTDDGDL